MKGQLNKPCLPARRLLPALLAGAALFGATAVSAATYTFQQITNNGNTSVAAQLSLVTSAFSATQTLFQIVNAGPVASSVDGVYFDWTSPTPALTPMSFLSDTGVAFTGSSGGNLPGGNTVTPLAFTSDYVFDADNPRPTNGINAGEFARFVGTGTQSAVEAALNAGLLRVGLHVQAIDPLGGLGGSESFVNPNGGGGPPAAVPVPAAVWLFGSALAGFMTLSNRRKLS